MGLVSGLQSGLSPGLKSGLNPGQVVDNPVFPSIAASLGAIMGEDPDVIHVDYSALPVPDGVSGLALTTSTGSPLFGQSSDRLWDGTDHTSRIVSNLVGTSDGYRLPSGAALTPLSVSFACMVVFRIATATTGNGNIVGKRSGGDLNGWNLSILTDGRVFAQVDHGPAHRSVIVPGSVVGNDWHVAMIVTNRNSDTLLCFTESAFATGTIAGYGDLDSTGEAFGHGVSAAVSAPNNGLEIAYEAYWAGAKAENLGMTELLAFWQPQLDNPPA